MFFLFFLHARGVSYLLVLAFRVFSEQNLPIVSRIVDTYILLFVYNIGVFFVCQATFQTSLLGLLRTAAVFLSLRK